MRREETEKKWRQKFKALNLDERFEFLYRNWNTHKGGKCGIRCKNCGAEFETWALHECIKGNQTYIRCSKCGTSSNGEGKLAYDSFRADEIAEFYTEGHSVRETAERFGLTKAQVNNFVRRKCLTNGRQWQDGVAEANKQRSKDAELRVSEHIDSLGFTYIGGYTNSDGYVHIRCKECGTEYKRTYDHIHRGNVVCIECQKRQTQERQAKMKYIAKCNAEMRQLERKWIQALTPKKNYYEDTVHQDFLNRTGICQICGKKYIVGDYMKSAGLKYAVDNGVCSLECKKEKKRRLKRQYKSPSNHRHRAKIHGVDYEPGITLKKLVMRDGLRCALCGELCDWNDHSWSKYLGPKHPTIDHIIPISKGGPHTWANVQVACAMCNSLKSDNVQECVEGGA